MTKPEVDPDTRHNSRTPLVVTMGDPAGIGPEITRKAWLAREKEQLPAFTLIADPRAFDNSPAFQGAEVPVELVTNPAEGAQHFQRALPVIPIECAEAPRAGQPTAANASAILQSIEMAVRLVQEGKASGLVTNPISKAHLYEAGFAHPGHTEYLAELGKSQTGELSHPVMMLTASELRVVPLTVHIPLKDVAQAITEALINKVVKITARALQENLAIENPRISVTGLNPHAGEMGAMGIEERDIIAPAIAALSDEGYQISGPHPADTIFHEAARLTYDVVIAMYHDQALIPIKTLAFDRGVNTTLGLPFVRTSPDHGTAFDIAGKNIASDRSLIEAIKEARLMSDNRLQFQEKSDV